MIEFAEGGGLDERYAHLPRSKNFEIMEGVARGMCYLHSQSPPVVHFDLKPENVLVTDVLKRVQCFFYDISLFHQPHTSVHIFLCLLALVCCNYFAAKRPFVIKYSVWCGC